MGQGHKNQFIIPTARGTFSWAFQFETKPLPYLKDNHNFEFRRLIKTGRQALGKVIRILPSSPTLFIRKKTYFLPVQIILNKRFFFMDVDLP